MTAFKDEFSLIKKQPGLSLSFLCAVSFSIGIKDFIQVKLLVRFIYEKMYQENYFFQHGFQFFPSMSMSVSLSITVLFQLFGLMWIYGRKEIRRWLFIRFLTLYLSLFQEVRSLWITSIQKWLALNGVDFGW